MSLVVLSSDVTKFSSFLGSERSMMLRGSFILSSVRFFIFSQIHSSSFLILVIPVMILLFFCHCSSHGIAIYCFVSNSEFISFTVFVKFNCKKSFSSASKELKMQNCWHFNFGASSDARMPLILCFVVLFLFHSVFLAKFGTLTELFYPIEFLCQHPTHVAG